MSILIRPGLTYKHFEATEEEYIFNVLLIEELKSIRLSKRYSQYALAKEAGVNKSYINQWEKHYGSDKKAKGKGMSLCSLLRICRVLDVNLSDVIKNVEKDFKREWLLMKLKQKENLLINNEQD